MSLTTINFGEKLAYWNQYVEGKKPIINEEKNSISSLDWDQQKIEIAQKLALEALQDLSQAREAFVSQINEGKINKAMICQVCELTTTIERIFKCILDVKIRPTLHSHSSFSENLPKLNQLTQSIKELSATLYVDDLKPQSAIEKLRQLPGHLSALEALIGENGLRCKPLLTRVLGHSNELLERCLINANLKTTQDLINLFEQYKNQNMSVIYLLMNVLEVSKENARKQMDPSDREIFDKRWTQPGTRDWIYENKITPSKNMWALEKAEAWDFLKILALEQELKQLIPDEKFLKNVRLYRGEKGDYYLKIENCDDASSGIKILGEQNFQTLKRFDNYLWSPNGQHFYLMDSGGGCPLNNFKFTNSFKTIERSNENCVFMNVDYIYALAFDSQGRPLAKYERQNLEQLRQVCSTLKSGKAQIIPFITARQPEYLFKMDDDQYIYVEVDYSKAYEGFEVYIGSKGFYQKLDVKKVERYRDGGTTIIHLSNGGHIYSPTPIEPNLLPYIENEFGHRHHLQKLDTETFDYSSIGIKLEPLNPRHTLMDLYK